MNLLRVLLVALAAFVSTSAYASVTLPFSTTYDCVEQQQADGTWVTCDGMSSYGGWTAANGGKEQITTAANYSGGGGGRGQRHWISNGTNSNSGSVVTSFTNPSTEIYIRWYVRFQSGLDLGSAGSPHKLLYWNDCTGNAGGCYFAINDTTVRLSVAGANYDNGGTWGWQDWMGGTTADGNWHWIELHVHRVSGSGNDVVEAWFDGTKRLDRSNVTFNGNAGGFDGAIIPENGAFVVSPTNIDMYEDIDDLAIQTTGPIGALSGGGGGGSSTGGSMDVRHVPHQNGIARTVSGR